MTSSQRRLVRALVRLYPRAWRERYADEMRALLTETRVTPGVVIDLIRGATREWIRAITVDPGPAVSSAREGWRNFRRTSFLTFAMASTTWYFAQGLRRVGVREDDWLWVLAAPALIVMLRPFWGVRRRSKFEYPVLKNGEVVPSEETVNPGITRREFWTSILLSGIAVTVWWTDRLAPDHFVGSLPQLQPFLHWCLLHQQMSMLRGRTKTVLARARQVHLLEIVRQRALRPPSPWA